MKMHTLRGPVVKYVSASEKGQKMEEGTIPASETKVHKIESDEDVSDFECYNESDGKPVLVDIDIEVTDGGPTLALLTNRKKKK